MLRWGKTLKRRIKTSGYGGRPITGVDLQPVKYGRWSTVFSQWCMQKARLRLLHNLHVEQVSTRCTNYVNKIPDRVPVPPG